MNELETLKALHALEANGQSDEAVSKLMSLDSATLQRLYDIAAESDEFALAAPVIGLAQLLVSLDEAAAAA